MKYDPERILLDVGGLLTESIDSSSIIFFRTKEAKENWQESEEGEDYIRLDLSAFVENLLDNFYGEDPDLTYIVKGEK